MAKPKRHILRCGHAMGFYGFDLRISGAWHNSHGWPLLVRTMRRGERLRNYRVLRSVCVANMLLLAVLFRSGPAWGWGSDGHKIIAIIAADNLTPAAQSHVANILGVPTDRVTLRWKTPLSVRILSFAKKIDSRRLGISSIFVCEISAQTFRRGAPAGTASPLRLMNTRPVSKKADMITGVLLVISRS